MAPKKELCDLHSGHEVTLKEHDRRLNAFDDNSVLVWDAIKKKCSNTFFILLCSFVIGGLAFQLAIYDTIKNVEKKVAVIEALINKDKGGTKATGE
jgi:hypothetical protein